MPLPSYKHKLQGQPTGQEMPTDVRGHDDDGHHQLLSDWIGGLHYRREDIPGAVNPVKNPW